jgi:hypothetical protein
MKTLVMETTDADSFTGRLLNSEMRRSSNAVAEPQHALAEPDDRFDDERHN